MAVAVHVGPQHFAGDLDQYPVDGKSIMQIVVATWPGEEVARLGLYGQHQALQAHQQLPSCAQTGAGPRARGVFS